MGFIMNFIYKHWEEIQLFNMLIVVTTITTTSSTILYRQ